MNEDYSKKTFINIAKHISKVQKCIDKNGNNIYY